MTLFRLDEYNGAVRDAVYGWIDRRTMEHAPSLRLFPRIAVEQVRPTRITATDGQVERIQPIHRHDEGKMDIRAVVDGSFDQLRETFDAEAAARAQALIAFWQHQVHRGLGSRSIVKAHGPPSWDSIMDALESLEIGFDDQNEPKFKTVAGPSAAELLSSLGARDGAQEARWQELMGRKMKEWHARQRRRGMA